MSSDAPARDLKSFEGGPQEIDWGKSASRVCRDRINDARWKHIGHLIRARRTLASSFRSPYRAV